MTRSSRLFIAFAVTSIVLYNLVVQNPPAFDRSRTGGFKSTSRDRSSPSCQIGFERQTEKSNLFQPKFSISARSNFMMPIVILDANNDSRPDVLLTGDFDDRNYLFVNQGQGRFKEEGLKYGFNFINPSQPTAAAVYDYSGDGLDDLVISYDSHLAFFRRHQDGNFQVDENIGPRPVDQLVTAINIADLQGDGEPDLILANYFDFARDRANHFGGNARRFLFMTNSRYNKKGGGRNLILFHENGRFRSNFDDSLAANTYSQAVGVSDLNNDGRPDLFFANDYYYDQALINQGNGRFLDQTDFVIPRIQHGLAGMNSEFFDYDRDGMLDLFVTNIFQKHFLQSGNVLWKKSANRFINKAAEAGVTDCGFAWGAKFADFNNDGQDDLFVTNGMFHMPKVTQPEEARSLWYLKYEMSQVPGPLKRGFEYAATERDEFSSFQSKCLFMQDQGKFVDIAATAGIDDRGDRRVVAVSDFDSDGRVDILMRGLSGIEFYRNTTLCKNALNENRWIGFEFIGERGSRVNPGLSIEFDLSDGRKIRREIYPSHGFNVFNDSRIHVGLGEAELGSDIQVIWPDKKRKVTLYQRGEFQYGTYNRVVQR